MVPNFQPANYVYLYRGTILNFLSFQVTSKKIRAEQEKELKTFRESLKQETKLLKQEVDLLPKSERKETLKARREALDADQNHREQLFLAKLNDTHESSLKRLSDTHREKIALLDRQFLQQKQQLMRAREAAIWVRSSNCFFILIIEFITYLVVHIQVKKSIALSICIFNQGQLQEWTEHFPTDF